MALSSLDDFHIVLGLFAYEFYEDGVRFVRETLAVETRRVAFERLKAAVATRSLPPGGAFRLVAEIANQPLYENSETEAYRWLDLMVRNVERTDGTIEAYAER